MTQPDPSSMVEAVTISLQAAQVRPEDAAACLLARLYAETIDEIGFEAYAEFGPKLLAVLTALGATLAGRKNEKGGVGSVSTIPSPLQALRDAARARTAAALDPTAS